MKWWFSFKNKFSIIRIPIGIILLSLFFSSLYAGFNSLIEVFKIILGESLSELFLFILLLPFIIEFFFFWASFYLILFFYPNIKKDFLNKSWKKDLMLLLFFIGILIIFALVGGLILRFLFGFKVQLGF